MEVQKEDIDFLYRMLRIIKINNMDTYVWKNELIELAFEHTEKYLEESFSYSLKKHMKVIENDLEISKIKVNKKTISIESKNKNLTLKLNRLEGEEWSKIYEILDEINFDINSLEKEIIFWKNEKLIMDYFLDEYEEDGETNEG